MLDKPTDEVATQLHLDFRPAQRENTSTGYVTPGADPKRSIGKALAQISDTASEDLRQYLFIDQLEEILLPTNAPAVDDVIESIQLAAANKQYRLFWHFAQDKTAQLEKLVGRTNSRWYFNDLEHPRAAFGPPVFLLA